MQEIRGECRKLRSLLLLAALFFLLLSIGYAALSVYRTAIDENEAAYRILCGQYRQPVTPALLTEASAALEGVQEQLAALSGEPDDWDAQAARQALEREAAARERIAARMQDMLEAGAAGESFVYDTGWKLFFQSGYPEVLLAPCLVFLLAGMFAREREWGVWQTVCATAGRRRVCRVKCALGLVLALGTGLLFSLSKAAFAAGMLGLPAAGMTALLPSAGWDISAGLGAALYAAGSCGGLCALAALILFLSAGSATVFSALVKALGLSAASYALYQVPGRWKYIFAWWDGLLQPYPFLEYFWLTLLSCAACTALFLIAAGSIGGKSA